MLQSVPSLSSYPSTFLSSHLPILWFLGNEDRLCKPASGRESHQGFLGLCFCSRGVKDEQGALPTAQSRARLMLGDFTPTHVYFPAEVRELSRLIRRDSCCFYIHPTYFIISPFILTGITQKSAFSNINIQNNMILCTIL